jgi:hypothetical protein
MRDGIIARLSLEVGLAILTERDAEGCALKNVYERPISLELGLEPKLRCRVISVEPDALGAGYFIAKYEVLNDDKDEFYQFEIRVPKEAEPSMECWISVFDSVRSFYSRKEDVLTYSYKLIQQIIDLIFKQTKKAPPKKEAVVKTGDEKPREAKPSVKQVAVESPSNNIDGTES